MPEASVIIPAYNHAGYIAEAVHSVLDQIQPDLELIVVDDGSTDDTLDVLAAISDPRMRVITQPNRGAHAAINRGLAQASGRFLAILNSDDAYHPNRLQQMLAELEADPSLGLAGSFIEVVDSQGQPLGVKHGYKDLEPWALEAPQQSFRAGDDLRAALLTENYWSTTSNFVFRRDWFERAGEFRPLRYTHDWDFALRMARLAPLSLLPQPLLRYRVHESNTIRENRAAMVFELCWCLAVHLPGHIEDTWFGGAAMAERQDQLLHSIYVYGFDRVLAVMLLQRLAERPDLALQLLEPDDPGRAKYLDYIQSRLSSVGAGRAAGPFAARLNRLKAHLLGAA